MFNNAVLIDQEIGSAKRNRVIKSRWRIAFMNMEWERLNIK